MIDEAGLGMRAFVTRTPGIGGRLRAEVDDFQVIEVGPGPRPWPDGKLAAARIRLRNWETNRFVGHAAKALNVKPGRVAFAGMKDKRAITEQWFTFPTHQEKIQELNGLQDVTVLETRRTDQRQHAGAHDGNRFVLRIRDHDGDVATVEACLEQIRATRGVPQFFGPQRFGSAVRPITHWMGKALVAGDLEDAVRLFCGTPFATEPEETQAARRAFEESGPAAALEIFPSRLDPERGILGRLARGDDERRALQSLPPNLLSLFIHAWQSYAFNHILSRRIEDGMGLATAHIGDRVMPIQDDGTKTTPVTAFNQARVQKELDARRAVLTAVLPGLTAPMATGEPGRIESEVLGELGMNPRQFRCHAMPELASPGRRRAILQTVDDLSLEWQDGDPVVGFTLGKGAYATVVMREIMKAPLDAY